jgi:hypothetical protein
MQFQKVQTVPSLVTEMMIEMTMKLEPFQEMKKTPKSSLESVAVACVQNALQIFQK